MNNEIEIDAIFRLLKEHLRAKRISYGELAKKMEMSESNIKRIFSSQSCSLHQIARICTLAETSIMDLVAVAAKRISPEFKLPAECEEFFIQNFDAFLFYRNLFSAKNVQHFIKHSKLPGDRLKKYLKSFEELKLIKRHRGIIEAVGVGYLSLADCPRLKQRLDEKWVPWFMGQVVHQPNNQDYSLKLASTGLTRAHKAQMLEDLNGVLQRYLDIGYQDQRIGDGEFEPVGICIGIGPHRVGTF